MAWNELGSLALIAGVATSAQAQWINFLDDTATRLTLDIVGINDGMEKDLDAADFDKDGWIDVIVVRKTPFSVEGPQPDVLFMNEGGHLVDRTSEYAPELISAPSDARDVACIDLNGDGWLDLAIATTFEDTPKIYMNLGEDKQGNWLGFANESLERTGDLNSTPFVKFCGVAAGDIDGDDDLDLWFVNYGGGDDVLWVNDGTGYFSNETDARLGNFQDVGFGTTGNFHDMDLDGDLDFVRSEAGNSHVLFNNGAGFFTAKQIFNTAADYAHVTGDFNDDGRMDVYTIEDPQDTIHLNIGANQDQNVTFQQFAPSPSPRTDGFGGSSRTADLDGDGDTDALIGSIDVDIANCPQDGVNGNPLALLRNDGTGQLSDPWPGNQNQNFHVASHDHVLIDINRDGCVDMFLGLCKGWRVFIQDGDCACVGDFNGDGALDILDFVDFQNAWTAGELAADIDGDGKLTILDFVAFQNAFQAGC